MADAADDDLLALPVETPEKLLARHNEERAALTKRHDRTRSSIPKKHRAERARFLEEAAADTARLDAVHRAEREDAGLTDQVLAAKFAHLSVAGPDRAAGDQQASPHISSTTPHGSRTNAEPPDLHPGQAQSSPPPQRESKAARRRRKKAEEEAASAARVEAARAAMGPSPKAVELAAIDDQLRPAGLRIHAIKADGHCLYGAVAHQLRALPDAPQAHTPADPSVAALRAATADHLWSRRDSFMPFVDGVDGDDDRFRAYCDTVRDTAEWGGQLELRALAERLRVVIEVYAADMPVVKMGAPADDNVSSPSADERAKPVLRVSFHRKYLGLGEHYNSVIPAGATDS